MAKKRAGRAKSAKVASKNSAATRVRKAAKRQQVRLAKKEARSKGKLPNSFRLVGQVYRLFKANWQKLLGIVLVYLILNIVFASGIGTISSTINTIKDNL